MASKSISQSGRKLMQAVKPVARELIKPADQQGAKAKPQPHKKFSPRTKKTAPPDSGSAKALVAFAVPTGAEEGWVQLTSATRLLPPKTEPRFQVDSKKSVHVNFNCSGPEGEIRI